jgi:hypothetical protein
MWGLALILVLCIVAYTFGWVGLLVGILMTAGLAWMLYWMRL